MYVNDTTVVFYISINYSKCKENKVNVIRTAKNGNSQKLGGINSVNEPSENRLRKCF